MDDPASPPPRGPLAGVRILDLTRVLAGPYCTMLLWELGAEVLKIEAPGLGDDMRTYPPFQGGESVFFATLNRGKRSLALDLTRDTDRALLDDLVKGADVLIENFRPGTMEKLGYPDDRLHGLNPGLVYARISGFGQTGPMRDLPAYDLIVQALSGMMSINGPEGGAGVRMGVSIGDMAAGMFAATAIAGALYERKGAPQTPGRVIDISMLDSQFVLLEQALVRFLAAGDVARPAGSRHPMITPFDVFRTADGPIAIACGNDRLFALLAAALGHPEWSADPRYASMFGRFASEKDLKADIEAALAADTIAGWMTRLGAAGVPCAPIHSVADIAQDPQIAARNMIVTVEDPELGALKVPGSVFKVSGFAESPTRPPAPNLDEARTDLAAWLAPRR